VSESEEISGGVLDDAPSYALAGKAEERMEAVELELRGKARFDSGPVLLVTLLAAEEELPVGKSGSMMPSEGCDRERLLRFLSELSSAWISPGLRE